MSAAVHLNFLPHSLTISRLIASLSVNYFLLLSLYILTTSLVSSIMPGRPLPTITSKVVASHNTSESCYVTRGTKVYNVTSFLDDHPGGGDLIVEYGGRDVTEIMGDEISHNHTDAAYEILDDNYLIGFVATEPIIKIAVNSEHPEEILPLPPSNEGIQELQSNGHGQELTPTDVSTTTGASSDAGLLKTTDASPDYKAHKFLDIEKPLLMQVWNGGFSKDYYLEQVHRPAHVPGGKSAPLFGNFLEPLSKTPWWLIPLVWLPWVGYGSYLAAQGLPSAFQFVAYWLTGLCLWTLVEYGLHRGLFHVDQSVSQHCQTFPSF